MDDSPDQVERARRDHPDIEFIQGDACDFTLARSVDVVFSNAVFQWIERDGQPDMLACVCRALRPGGIVCVRAWREGKERSHPRDLGRAFTRHDCEYTIALHFLAISKYAFLKEAVDFKVRTTLLSERRTRFVCTNGLHD